MVVRFAKWGQSIAFRLPSEFAREIGAVAGTTAELSVENGRLVLTPVAAAKHYDLETLVAGITDENIHGEIDAGIPVGREVW